MDKISSEALCAHIHDVMIDHGVTQEAINALVTTIYDSDRTIAICKEIAALSKYCVGTCTMYKPTIDLDNFHHIPLERRNGKVITDEYGTPYLPGFRWSSLNKLLHLPPSDTRDKSLILMTKLHGLVNPLRIDEGVRQTVEMIKNIESPHVVDLNLINRFRRHVKSKLLHSDVVANYDYRKELMPLHALACQYMGSQKKKPCVQLDEQHGFYINSEAEAQELESYILPNILTSKPIRDLYEFDKLTFLTLVTGHGVTKVIDDSDIIDYPICNTEYVGRMGIRLQEAEKIRTLWMPFVVYESLVNPAVVLLERIVKASPHQTIYIDDALAASSMRNAYFPKGGYAREPIYSIDQSAFTDNFPYQLQRVVLEELVNLGKIPKLTLLAFDSMVQGGYLAGEPYTKYGIRFTKPVVFLKGTPMGDPGAFMLATLTHEYLVSMLQEDMCTFTPYYIQGDDCTLQGDMLFKEYHDTMSALGCTVNQDKTLQSVRAIEYCGYISTSSISVPMYRPHDRLVADPRDIISPRALESFGERKLIDWIEVHRPNLIEALQVAGLISIPIDGNHEALFELRDVCLALTEAESLIQQDVTRERLAMMGLIQSFYPSIEHDDTNFRNCISLEDRSDYTQYIRKISSLKHYRDKLLRDPTANPYRVSAEILNLCDDLNNHHQDYISEMYPIEDAPRAQSRNPHKPYVGKVIKSLSSAERILRIYKQNKDKKEDIHHDEYSL